MNAYIIAGVLLVALGTAVIIYGQALKSKADNAEAAAELQAKVEQVLDKVEQAKQDASGEPAEQIDAIEEEFRRWASEFLKTRTARKVQIERAILESSATQLQVTSEVKPVFEYALTTIESLARAFNTASSESIEVKFPPLPENLYSEAATEYPGTVIFGPDAVWRVVFLSTKPPRRQHPPSMYISFQQSAGRVSLNSWLQVQPRWPKEDQLRVDVNGANIPAFDEIEGVYPLAEYRERLKTILQKLFEAQLLRSATKTQ